MFTLFLLGNIASGKSYVARYFECHGAMRIDLDQMAKDMYQPGSQVVDDLCEHFGFDVLDESGCICKSILAERAFSSPEETDALNAIVHPALLQQLSSRLLPTCCTVEEPRHTFTVVEVSAPKSFCDAFPLADEIMLVAAPYELRRERAHERGMSYEDFERRARLQQSEEELGAFAHVIVDNSSDISALELQLDAWLESHGFIKEATSDHA